MEQSLSSELIFRVGPVEITRIIILTWAVMGAIVAAAAALRFTLRKNDPARPQQIVEAMLSWLGEEIEGIIGRDPAPFVPLVASLFIFILASNLSSLFMPVAGLIKPPTADLNTTVALASVVFVAVPFYGIVMTGAASYLKTYVRPVWIMLPFNVISDLSRTIALAIRLFGNVFSGEILIGVILALVPFFLPLPLMFLSLITGTIQAYIFAILTIVYIGGAVRTVERHRDEGESQ